jgi:hypothetical protein
MPNPEKFKETIFSLKIVKITKTNFCIVQKYDFWTNLAFKMANWQPL